MNSLKKPTFSIIIPVPKLNNYILKETIPALKRQTYKHFELIIIPNHLPVKNLLSLPFLKLFPSHPHNTPSEKRNLGAKKAKGKILVFLDDDAYPDKNWLKNALSLLKNKNTSAVCGPGLTPPNDPLLAKVSGYFWSSYLGSGGAGTYRNLPQKTRSVDDYPSFNFFVRKKDFLAAGGFDSRYWPGEDTKLCHDLVYKLEKKIVYHPQILVYHHRRPIFKPHLKQLSRYAAMRARFTLLFPQTSKKLSYYLPAITVLIFFLTPPLIFFFPPLLLIYLSLFALYILALLLTFIHTLFITKNLLLALLLVPTTPISHLTYGLVFLKTLLFTSLDKHRV